MGEYGRINHYKGFGRDQSFWIVDAQDSRRGKFSQFKPGKGEALKSGDTVQVNCVYDRRCKYATAKNGAMQNGNCRKTPERIQYGLSHGNEMCGFLMMYYPHDPAHFFPQGSLVTNPQFIQEMPLSMRTKLSGMRMRRRSRWERRCSMRAVVSSSNRSARGRACGNWYCIV